MAYLDLMLQRKLCSSPIIRETTRRKIEGLSPVINKQNYYLLLIIIQVKLSFKPTKVLFHQPKPTITVLTLPHLRACPKPGLQTSCGLLYFK